MRAARFPLAEGIVAAHASALGRDVAAYGNHVCRGLHFYVALSGGAPVPDAVQIAAGFHDLGIWTHDSFDYLGPSMDLASAWLEQHGRQVLDAEVRAIIGQHHKLRPYAGPHAESVERFRRADLVDLSLGLLPGGLSRETIRAVRGALPNAGFHRRLVLLTLRQCVRDPLHPLPMFRW